MAPTEVQDLWLQHNHPKSMCRAPAQFQKLGVAEAHSLLQRLGPELGRQMHPNDFCAEQMSRCLPLHSASPCRRCVCMAGVFGFPGIIPHEPELLVNV